MNSCSELGITAWIEGRGVARSEVLEWESRRATKVMKRLGVAALSDDVFAQREALVARKLELGHEGVERLLARQLRTADRIGRLTARLVRGHRYCTIELTGDRGSCELLPQWYHDAIASNDEAPLLAACPDHYILRTLPDGREEVIETPGAGPLTLSIFLDEANLEGLTTATDPAFPTQWAAIGRNSAGLALGGGIRHQFRDDPGGGFRARLTVQFPKSTPPKVLREHRWHLACEFSNWIELANQTAA